MNSEKKSKTYTAITGLIMGMAEVVPGVSGGTIAFVAGIYEKLVETIDNTRVGIINLKKEGVRGFLKRIDLAFIFSLLSGMVLGIITGVLAITYFLENYPPVIWSFFFGLIVGSCVYMLAKLRLKWQTFLILGIGAAVAYTIGLYNYGSGIESGWFILICGMIAITALVLPGISGSFMLLMLGMYTFIINDTLKGLLTDFSFGKLYTLFIFGLGCLIGLFSIAKALRWALSAYYNTSIALLTGFMIGSLQRIWPWRNPELFLNKSTGEITELTLSEEEYKVISEVLVTPSAYEGDPHLLLSCMIFLIGLVAIGLFARYERG